MKTKLVLKPIPVSPNDDYMAGSDGQIYSRTKHKGFGRKELVDWYPLRGHMTSKGYRTISMSHENVKVTKSVHRLVCMAFHGMPPVETMEVRHLNGNANDNRPENLCWGTAAENWQDKRAHIRWAVERGLCSQRQAARALGVALSSIQGIVSAGRASG